MDGAGRPIQWSIPAIAPSAGSVGRFRARPGTSEGNRLNFQSGSAPHSTPGATIAILIPLRNGVHHELCSIDSRRGIRGIIPACCLIKLEEQLGGLTRDHINYCAGTSTGALLTAAVAAGVPATRHAHGLHRTFQGDLHAHRPDRGCQTRGRGLSCTIRHISATCWSSVLGAGGRMGRQRCPHPGDDLGHRDERAQLVLRAGPTRQRRHHRHGEAGGCGGGVGLRAHLFQPLDHRRSSHGKTRSFFDGGAGGTANPGLPGLRRGLRVRYLRPRRNQGHFAGHRLLPGFQEPPSGLLATSAGPPTPWSTLPRIGWTRLSTVSGRRAARRSIRFCRATSTRRICRRFRHWWKWASSLRPAMDWQQILGSA